LIGSNRIAAEAVVEAARAMGFEARLLTTYLEGEAREVGRVVAALTKSLSDRASDENGPQCVVLGGETTVTLRGEGLGGRNQELALAAAIALEGWPGVCVMALATDGVDGPTPAAGAVISGETLQRGRQAGLDALKALMDNDSHRYLAALGEDMRPGPTGTNVNDLILCAAYPGDPLPGRV
jgi:hydroxypyruvate reductase